MTRDNKNKDATADATPDAPTNDDKPRVSESVAADGVKTVTIDERKPAPSTEGAFKPAAMSDESKAAFNDREDKPLTGRYAYLGATTFFECREKKEHALVRGKVYEIAKLPKHEIVGNAILRRLLVKADTQTKQEA